MAEASKIEWCDHTFNPWTGCTKVSAACDHCYAEGWAKRSGHVEWGPHAPRRRTSPDYWKQPLKWNAKARDEGVRRKVFCASLADLFDNHKSIDAQWRYNLWELIADTPHLDWLLLTKRPQNIARYLPDEWDGGEWGGPWPNVWLGTTVENQEEADRRIPHLLQTPAAVRFLSCEPLLGPIDLNALDVAKHPANRVGFPLVNALTGSWHLNPEGEVEPIRSMLKREISLPAPNIGINWVIVGGESGPGARPMHPDWARSLRDQCKEAGTPFFFKQWGDWTPGENVPHTVTGIKPHAHWFAESWSFGKTNMDDPEDGWMDPPDVYRIGKKRAGRLLDGVEHNEMPEGE